MKKSINELIANTKWVYALDENKPHENDPEVFLVCVAVLNEPGMTPALWKGATPWYLDHENCEELNRKRGYSPSEVDAIAASGRATLIPK